MIFVNFAALIFSFVILFKAADYFVLGASGIADVFKIPKLIIGIVLVSLATTAPEFSVSVIAAFLGNLEISLGNAVGSVICDDGIAIAMAALFAPAAILINCRILKFTAVFLISIDIFVYLLILNGVIGRLEGVLFILILVVYFVIVIRNSRDRTDVSGGSNHNGHADQEEHLLKRKAEIRRCVLFLIGGVSGVILASFIVNWSAVHIAEYFSISETVIGSTIVAIGTSIPEIAICIIAALRGEGEIAVGNILGADVLNVLWIIGAAAIVRPLQVDSTVINFTFPYMILIVVVMLVCMRIGCRLGKVKGLILFSMYLIYLGLTVVFFA
ncbi:MAG: calcium/sodium antiporter [Candidatus Aminicenantes bacterium]|nr:calcium/sodium antiporter [Candidatus Aminicenantes bacterium]